MKLADELDRALDDAEPGEVSVESEGRRAEAEVTDVDRLGVRVRRLRVRHAEDRDIGEEAERLASGLRGLGEAVEPVEVDPGLGGAILRSRPRRREFWQVEVDGPREVELRRYRIEDDGRSERDFTVTREQLGRLVDELGEADTE